LVVGLFQLAAVPDAAESRQLVAGKEVRPTRDGSCQGATERVNSLRKCDYAATCPEPGPARN